MTDDAPKRKDISELLEILRFHERSSRIRLLAVTLTDLGRDNRATKPPRRDDEQ